MLTKLVMLQQVGKQEGEVGWGKIGWAFQFGKQLGNRIRILKEHTL